MAIRLFTSLLMLLLMGIGQSVAASEGNSTYKLASGDVIRIHVLSATGPQLYELRLTDAGTFSYPFIGEVRARGKTTAQIERILTEQLQGEFLVD